MKSSLLLIACFALTATAKEFKIELEAVPGEDQVFFLDLASTGADSSTFRLTDPEGKEIPFSFDFRIVRPAVAGKYQKPVDGYYSKDTAPASENRFLQPGWLSFKKTGAKKYFLTFLDGARETLPRPNPSVRAWWIEIMRDPELKSMKYIGYPKNSAKALSGGGIEFTRPIQFWMRGTTADSRINGRRILSLMRCEGDFTFYSIRLKSAVRKNGSAIACYFKPVPGEVIDLCAEGIIGQENTIKPNTYFAGVEYVKGLSRIYSFRVQLPPSEHSIGIKLKSDVFNRDEKVDFESFGTGYENIVPFESGGIKGARVGVWTGKPTVKYSLNDAGGKKVKSGTGMQFKLDSVKAGRYQLETELLLDDISVGKKCFPVIVQEKPF